MTREMSKKIVYLRKNATEFEKWQLSQYIGYMEHMGVVVEVRS